MSTSFPNIPLTSFKEHYVYALDEILIVFNSKSFSLHVLDELSSWLFLSLDAGLSKVELRNELIENNIDSEWLETTFEQIEEILMPCPVHTSYKQEYADIIASLPTWERNDGRRSKYIALPYSDHNLPETTVKCIVFPHYQASIKDTELISMDSISALKQLTSAGYQIRDGLTKEKVEQILGWISITPAYHLSYSHLDDAHDVIEKLMTT